MSATMPPWDVMHCDASNLTGIVDRLEARGIVERRAVAGDRRVKELVLTEAGRDLQERLDEIIGFVPGLSDMSPDEQQALMRLLGGALDRLLRPSGEHHEVGSPGSRHRVDGDVPIGASSTSP